MVDIYSLNLNDVVFNRLKEMNAAKRTAIHKSVKKTNEFSASQSSYGCLRMIFYNMTTPRTSSNPEAIGTYAIGDIVHDILESSFVGVGGKAGTRLTKGYLNDLIYISGESDILLDDAVIEVKSVSVFAWKYVDGGKDFRTGETLIGAPKQSHINQLNTYLDLYDKEKGIILYVNKENFKLRPFYIKRDKSVMLQTVGKCIMVYNRIQSNELPDKEKGNECAWCNYTDLCKKNKLN